MNARKSAVVWVQHILHRHLLGLIVLSYALASTFPSAGLWIKDARIVDIDLTYTRVKATLPMLLLAFLLFNAGLRVRAERLRAMVRRPTVILAGLIANLSVPVAYLMVLIPILGQWHNPDEMATILVGLALVASMPVAGSSTGWAQTANGDMALSLGLVVASTLLSPITTPFVLRLLGVLAPENAADDLHLLAGHETGTFLMAWVLIPSLLGMAVRRVIPERYVHDTERRLKPLATLTLLVLCYANASACLPEAIGHPDWDFLGIVLIAVVGLCVLTFTAGYALGNWLRADREQRAALIFGMGMNNNGTGLVLASVALASQPLVLLPVIFYNLTQHVVAGCVDILLERRPLLG